MLGDELHEHSLMVNGDSVVLATCDGNLLDAEGLVRKITEALAQ